MRTAIYLILAFAGAVLLICADWSRFATWERLQADAALSGGNLGALHFLLFNFPPLFGFLLLAAVVASLIAEHRAVKRGYDVRGGDRGSWEEWRG